ncbi:MAG: helix-turn-helix domain-containing protein [Pseudomonadota bacterium]
MTPGERIKSWRKIRGLSQAVLAERCNMSTRHMSFIETGRAKPAVHTLQLIANAIAMPRGEYDQLLLSAGFAPSSIDEKYITDQYSALSSDERVGRHQLINECVVNAMHDVPVAVVDGEWTIRECNGAFQDLTHLTTEEGDPRPSNLMRWFFQDRGLGDCITEWPHLSVVLLLALRKDAMHERHDHGIHRLLNDISAKAGDERGAEILEPYEMSAVGFPFTVAFKQQPPRRYLFTTLSLAMPMTSAAKSHKFALFYPLPSAASD